MESHFFPNEVFGWTYFGSLSLIALVAAGLDFRSLIIPKWLTYPTAGLGLAINVVRAAWVGSEGHQLWLLGAGNFWKGLVDGFLLSLFGFLVGFTVLFVMWLAKTCGGGDVKLFGAVGAWVGPVDVLYILAISLPILMVVMVIKGIIKGSFVIEKPKDRDVPKKKKKNTKKRKKSSSGEKPGGAKPTLSYSFPVAVAVIIVLLWRHRSELDLQKPVTDQRQEAAIHVR